MSNSRKAVYAAEDSETAALLKAVLAEAGVAAEISDAKRDEAPAVWRVSVSSKDFAQALAIAEEFERQRLLSLSAPFDDEATERQMDAGLHGEWLQWPACATCGQRRQTICDTCGQPGDDFPLADPTPLAVASEPVALLPIIDQAQIDAPLETASVELLLLCTTCDEAFAPRFFRHCARCGHDFGDGREIKALPPSEEPTARVTTVIITLAILTMAMLLYFWLLLR